MQKITPMVVFILAGPQINSVISLAICRLLHSIVIPDTPVKPSNFHEMLSSTQSKGLMQRSLLQYSVSCLLSVSESITKVFCLFIGLIFTSSELELCSEELSSSEMLVYILLGQSEKV